MRTSYALAVLLPACLSMTLPNLEHSLSDNPDYNSLRTNSSTIDPNNISLDKFVADGFDVASRGRSGDTTASKITFNYQNTTKDIHALPSSMEMRMLNDNKGEKTELNLEYDYHWSQWSVVKEQRISDEYPTWEMQDVIRKSDDVAEEMTIKLNTLLRRPQFPWERIILDIMFGYEPSWQFYGSHDEVMVPMKPRPGRTIYIDGKPY